MSVPDPISPEAEAILVAMVRAAPVKWEMALDGDEEAVEWLRWAGGKPTKLHPFTIEAWLRTWITRIQNLDNYTKDWSHNRFPQVSE